LADLARFLRVRYGEAVHFIDVNRLLPFGEAAQDKAQVVLDADGWWNALKIVGELVSSGWTVRESFPGTRSSTRLSFSPKPALRSL